jgi:hypothetical protein
MPPWSVPPGLMGPSPRQPQAEAQESEPAAESRPAAEPSATGQAAASEPPATGQDAVAQAPQEPVPEPALPEPPLPEPALPEPALPEPAAAGRATPEPPAGDDSWPGVAPPAGWFLRVPRQPGSARPGPGSGTSPRVAARPDVGGVPSPRREPDGSWSSPLTTKSPPRALGPTQARYGRAGGAGFQLVRPGQPDQPDQPGQQSQPDAVGQHAGALSPWQKSHQLWTEAGIQWEQRPPAPRHTPDPRTGPEPHVPEPAAAGWPGSVPMPLGAPVSSDPDVEEDDDPGGADRWGDDRPPIWERPPGLVPPPAPGDTRRMQAGDTRWMQADDTRRMQAGDTRWMQADDTRWMQADDAQAGDTLWFDDRAPGSRRRGPGLLGRRTATILIPVIVVVAVAVLAIALLTGHGPKFGPLASNQHRTPNTVAPQLPLAAVSFDTYPGQQQRGVFQQINRVVAAGNTMVTIGSQTSDGVVRQQFLVSTNAGASWLLAPAHAPSDGQAALDHPAALLAGGWVAVGPQAIWTSPSGLTWTLAATHGISPQLPGDSVWVITKTADGFLAAGATTNASASTSTGKDGATQAVIWTSRDGVTWQRMTAAQLGLAGPGETVLNISYATSHANATVISGTVLSNTGTRYDAAWLSTNDGAAWTRVTIPADHGAGTAISGLAFDGAGLIAVRAGRTASGAADGIAYFSPNGQAWQYSATIDPAGGWTAGVVKGSDYGFVVTGTSAPGQLVGYTSTGDGTAWLPTGPLGDAASESVVGATVAPAGTIIAVGYTTASRTGQQPVLEEAGTSGSVRPVPLAGIAGAVIPEMKINGTAVVGGLQIAVGSANGYPAVWRKIGGGAWTLVSSLALAQSLAGVDPGLRALTSVTHGPAGWLAVGAPGPIVLTSADGTTWRVAGGNITQDLAGVSAVAATSGPAGYVIVGKLVAAGGSCVADVWWSPNLTSWTRAHDVNDATGSSQVLAVAASAHGFVSVGSHDGTPAVWVTNDGRAWETFVLPLPDGAATAVLQQIAINGNTVVALGQASPANAANAANAGTVPFAELSEDGGITWQQAPFTSPGPDTTFTALTADSAGFTAAGLFGPPGQQDVAVWRSANGVTWKPSQSGGLNGSEAWQIDALAAAGSAVTGIGAIITQQNQQTVTFTLPSR